MEESSSHKEMTRASVKKYVPRRSIMQTGLPKRNNKSESNGVRSGEVW